MHLTRVMLHMIPLMLDKKAAMSLGALLNSF